MAFNETITVKEESHIGGMIIMLIHFFKLRILKIHNLGRSTSRIIHIGSISEQLCENFFEKLSI